MYTHKDIIKTGGKMKATKLYKDDKEDIARIRRSWEHIKTLMYTIDSFTKKYDVFLSRKPVPDGWYPILDYRGYIFDPRWLQPMYTKDHKWQREKLDYLSAMIKLVKTVFEEALHPRNKNHKVFCMREKAGLNAEIYTIVFIKDRKYIRYRINDFEKYIKDYKLDSDSKQYTFMDVYSDFLAKNTDKPLDQIYSLYYETMIEKYFTDVTYQEVQDKTIKHVVERFKLKSKERKVVYMSNWKQINLS